MGTQQKFPWCTICRRRTGKSLPPIVCMGCCKVVCFERCSKPINLSFNRWCSTCITRNKLKSLDSIIGPFNKDLCVKNIGFRRFIYPKHMPYVFHLQDVLNANDLAQVGGKLCEKVFKPFINFKKRTWKVDKFAKEVFDNLEGSHDGYINNPSKRKATFCFNGTLKKAKNDAFFKLLTSDLEYGSKAFKKEWKRIENKIPYSHATTTLTEESFKKYSGVDLKYGLDKVLEILRNKTTLPVGANMYKYCHELVGNIVQGINSHKDISNGENFKPKTIGYLPIIILMHWGVFGWKEYSMFKDDSLRIPVFTNSVVVIIGGGAEELYHKARIYASQKFGCPWYVVSQLRIPELV